MECPNCHHVSAQTAKLKCSSCGQIYSRDSFEEYQHLAYMKTWLQARNRQAGSSLDALLSVIKQEQSVLLNSFGIQVREKPVILRELALIQAIRAHIPGWFRRDGLVNTSVRYMKFLLDQIRLLETELGQTEKNLPKTSELEAIDFFLECLPAWSRHPDLLAGPDAQELEKILAARKKELLAPAPQVRSKKEAELAYLHLLSAKHYLPGWAAQKRFNHNYVEQLGRFIQQEADKCLPELGDKKVKGEVLPEQATILSFLKSMESWYGARLKEGGTAQSKLYAYLNTRLKELQVAPAASVKAAAVTVEAVPKRKPFEFSQLVEKIVNAAVSGALLRGLLYLGAFMIVVSAAVLTILFWDVFPQGLQLLFIACVPTIFYLVGWLVRGRMKLPQAGNVLSGIGALLVAVDFAAVFQFGGLAGMVNASLYWVIASVVCLAVYLLTAWRLKGIFFDYISLLAATSLIVALTRLAALPLEWGIAGITLAGTLMCAAAMPIEKGSQLWRGMGIAARHLAQIFLPVSMASILTLPGKTFSGEFVIFLLAAIGYGLLAWSKPAPIFAHSATWILVGAVYFGLKSIHLPIQWYACAAAVLGMGYLLFGRFFIRKLDQGLNFRQAYLVAVYLAGFGMLAVSTLGGVLSLFEDYWAGVISLGLVALETIGLIFIFQSQWFASISSAFFLLPFSLALGRWLQDADVPTWRIWLMTGWVTVSLVYLGLAAGLRKHAKYVLWLNVWSLMVLPVALVVIVITYSDWADSTLAALVSLGGGALYYLAACLLHDSGQHPALSRLAGFVPQQLRQAVFAWPLGLLFPVWMAVAWDAASLPAHWLGTALAGMGLVYAILGWWFGKRQAGYRFVAHVYTYLLGIAGIFLAVGDSWPLFSCLVLGVLALGLMAWIYRRLLEISLAALLFIWPFQLILTLLKVTPHAQSLAYALAAGLVYTQAGILLDRGEKRLGLPVLLTGYGLSLYALVASMLGRFGVYPLDLAWVGVVVPLLITGLYVFSAWHFQSFQFSWAAVLTQAILFGQLLTLLRLAPAFDALAWVGLAFVDLTLGWSLKRVRDNPGTKWLALFHWPLTIAAWMIALLGVGLTVQRTTWSITLWQVQEYRLPGALNPVIFAQALAFGFSLLAARIHRKVWPASLSPILAFFPTTLFFIAHGERLFGKALSTSQYGWVWLGLGTLFLVAAALLDRNRIRYAHALYSGGYLLVLLALFWSTSERLTLIVTLAGVILVALLSQVLVHFNSHRSFNDLLNSIWTRADTLPKRTARIAFLFLAVYAFPFWLTHLFAYWDLGMAWRGLGLALVAPLYIALALLLRRVRSEYTWPLYSAAYTLTAIAAMLSFEDLRLSIWVLSLDALVFLASGILFRQSFWLYLTNVLVPVISLLILKYNGRLDNTWVAGVLMGLAYLYLGIGWLVGDRHGSGDARHRITPFSMSFYSLAYLLGAVSLAAASSDKWTALYVFTAGALLNGFSAWFFRETLFLYPAVWLAAIPYYLLVSLTPLEIRWYGLAWLPLVVACILLGRLVFHREPIWPKNGKEAHRSPFAFLAHPALPFYLLAYGLSVSMVAASAGDALALTLALVSATLIYLGTVFLMRHPAWLYPALLAAHLSILAYFAMPPTSGRPAHYISIPFLVMTWVVALAGFLVSRRFPVTRQSVAGRRVFRLLKWELDFGQLPSIGYLVTPSWSQPIFIFALADILIWQSVAMRGFQTALLLALGYALLLGLFAMLWMDSGLVYACLAFLLLAAGLELEHLGLYGLELVVAFAAIGLVLYWVGRLVGIAARKFKAASLWEKPLEISAILVTSTALLISLPGIFQQTSLTAGAIACAGALYLAVAYRGRYHRLGYLGMAMLELAWILALVMNDVSQPQWYAIPTGLYFTGVGILEGRRGRKLFATILESFGLAVLLVTAFIQSLNGVEGFPYFILLLVEGVLIIWWGAVRRNRTPLFAGISASVLNVVAQVVVLVNVYDINRWFIFLGVGILLITSAVLIERKREAIISQSRTWRQELEKWD